MDNTKDTYEQYRAAVEDYLSVLFAGSAPL